MRPTRRSITPPSVVAKGPSGRWSRKNRNTLLDPQYATWDELIRSTIDAVIEEAKNDGSSGGLAPRHVGADYNVITLSPPASSPGVYLRSMSRWLDMSEIARWPDDNVHLTRCNLRLARRVRSDGGVHPGHRRYRASCRCQPDRAGQHTRCPPFLRPNAHDAWVNGDPIQTVSSPRPSRTTSSTLVAPRTASRNDRAAHVRPL
jgi:hypothetical protein